MKMEMLLICESSASFESQNILFIFDFRIDEQKQEHI